MGRRSGMAARRSRPGSPSFTTSWPQGFRRPSPAPGHRRSHLRRAEWLTSQRSASSLRPSGLRSRLGALPQRARRSRVGGRLPARSPQRPLPSASQSSGVPRAGQAGAERGVCQREGQDRPRPTRPPATAPHPAGYAVERLPAAAVAGHAAFGRWPQLGSSSAPGGRAWVARERGGPGLLLLPSSLAGGVVDLPRLLRLAVIRRQNLRGRGLATR